MLYGNLLQHDYYTTQDYAQLCISQNNPASDFVFLFFTVLGALPWKIEFAQRQGLTGETCTEVPSGTGAQDAMLCQHKLAAWTFEWKRRCLTSQLHTARLQYLIIAHTKSM